MKISVKTPDGINVDVEVAVDVQYTCGREAIDKVFDHIQRLIITERNHRFPPPPFPYTYPGQSPPHL